MQAASLTIELSPRVKAVHLANDLQVAPVETGLQVELGDFWAGEERKLVVVFEAPQMPALGLAQIATLRLRYVDVIALKEQTISIPLHVNVVPGDEAAGRVVNPVVATELAFQLAQRAKREASRSLSVGDDARALHELRSARTALADALGSAPSDAAAELNTEVDVIEQMIGEAEYGETTRAAKFLSADVTRKSRTRGGERRREPPFSGRVRPPAQSWLRLSVIPSTVVVQAWRGCDGRCTQHLRRRGRPTPRHALEP